jgi:transcriptional regulator with XRE-family HTH domain
MPNAFSDLVKSLRRATGMTLRAFCVEHDFDPGNWSRLERGQTLPPNDEEKLAQYAIALGLSKHCPAWVDFFDRAAAAQGRLPKDLRDDANLTAKLPLLFRTLRGTPVPPDRLEKLADKIRES